MWLFTFSQASVGVYKLAIVSPDLRHLLPRQQTGDMHRYRIRLVRTNLVRGVTASFVYSHCMYKWCNEHIAFNCGCVLSCVGCGLPLVPGNCSFNISSHVRFFFNASSGQCQQFDFEGCGSNGNNFETLRECQDICRELA